MMDRKYLALKAPRMLVKEHFNRVHYTYVDNNGQGEEIEWKEVYKILDKMVHEMEGKK